MCTPGGQLMFYTNGMTVWNRNHQVMPGGSGLLGHTDATQSCIIVPKPSTRDRYYIFTLDNLGGADGLRYSEVDMSLAGGLGDIVASAKNIQLETSVSEKLTAIRHANGTDYWVLAHGISNNRFFIYQVSASGISSTTADIGSTHPSLSTGYMKFSPNGKKVACAINSTKTVDLFDFDNSTGTLSSPYSITLPASPYGIEFSPDNSKLYVSAGKTIYQYTIPSIYSQTLLTFSEKTILSDYQVWGLQLGPDHKIYICKSGSALGVLNNPDNDALNAGFTDNYLILPNDAKQGLPNSMTHFFNESFIDAGNTCAGQQTQFNILLNGLDSVRWDFGDASAGARNSVNSLNPQFIYNAPGIYTVSATVYNKGYSATFSDEITIHALPVFSLGADTVLCKGQVLSYNFYMPGATYLWNNGNKTGKNIITTPGKHWLEITTNGCKVKREVTVAYDILNPDFSISKEVQCLQGNKFEFTSTTPGSPMLKWEIENNPVSSAAQITTSFTAPGVKKVTLWATSKNNCRDSIEKEVIVNDNPKASFDIVATDNCGFNNSFKIKDRTAYSGTYTATYEVENKTVNQNNFTYSFSGPGQYKVKQTIKTAEGCFDAAEKTVLVYDAPAADFDINTVSACEGSNQFEFTKTTPLKVYETITWWVDNNPTAPGKLLQYTTSGLSAGKHSIKAVVKNMAGCEASIEKQVEVVKKPVVNFSTAENRLNCVGSSPVQFINLSSDRYAITKTSWDFGDLTTSSQNEPEKQYTTQNTYTVTLRVENEKGCAASVSKTISTYEKPVAMVTATGKKVCESDNLFELHYNNSNTAALVDNFVWMADNGETITNQNPAFFSFNTAGNHNIRLIATTANGCSDSANIIVKVQPNPKAQVEVNNPTQCLENNKVKFEAKITLGGGVVKDITWDFGNGSVLKNVYGPSVSYRQAGAYPVKLLLEDEHGCTTEEITRIEIYPSPVVNIEAVKGCTEQPVKLKINGLQSGITVSEWHWSLGDGNTAGIAEPEHTYSQPGNYTLNLTVISDNGCRHIASLANAVQIAPTPVVNFEYEKTYWSFDETVVKFKALTSIPGKNYKWDFGNGKTGSTADLQVKYDKADYYNVKLEVETPAGCSNSFSQKILIVPPFDAYVPTSFTPNGDSKNDLFGMEGVEFITSYKMQIMNRWGEKIFFSDNLKLKWDGTFNGDPLPPDIYSYKIDITDAEDRPYTLKGTIQLIR